MPRRIKLPLKAPPPQPAEAGKPAFPVFEPLHIAFTGRSRVLSYTAHAKRNYDGETYTVDLGAGTCTCRYGKTWHWSDKYEKWVSNVYCSHKIRALADIVERGGRTAELQKAYCKAVASRYNVFEVVSAFHKELRRGAVDQAVFWGHMLATFRGLKGVINYMLGIIYEETRDHELAGLLLEMTQGKVDLWGDGDYSNMLAAIQRFCVAPKKWELAHRVAFFEAEMKAYCNLLDVYGRDVAKMLNVIPDKEKPKLLARMRKGLARNDLVEVQYGFKGLQALKTGDGNLHRAWIANAVIEACGNISSKQGAITDYIQAKANAQGISYHDLNMLVDFLTGEPYSAGEWKRQRNNLTLPELRLGVAPTIPIYAHDNHTWAGKALLRRFPNEWQPGAKQENIDLRLCGAYMGVAWRTLAYAQHQRIDCAWDAVEWPKWLHETVSNLWY